ncbi:MAG: septum site-determining protein MinC [Campylobacterales bacterium]
MQAKQKNIKIFDITCDDATSLDTLLTKNGALIKNYLVVLKECTKECENIAKKHSLRYIVDNGDFPKYSISKKEVISHETQVDENKSEDRNTQTHLVLNKTLRSGTSIEHTGSFTLFGRVNSGARIEVDGEVSIYGDIDGSLEVRGKFIILKGKVSGSIIFNGEILESSLFDGGLKKVAENGEKVVVEEI